MDMSMVIRSIRTKTTELNFFETHVSEIDPFARRTAIISTRAYIILLTAAITILITFNAFESQTHSITIRNPSASMYKDFYEKYSTTFSCPCRENTIRYNQFVSIDPSYHPICTSKLVSPEWFNLIYNENISFYFTLDFRSSALGQFQLLGALCSLARRTINDAINDFLFNSLTSMEVISPLDLIDQNEVQSSFIRNFQGNAFRRLLRLIRTGTFSNQFLTSLQTSIHFDMFTLSNGRLFQSTVSNHYSTSDEWPCLCVQQQTCALPVGVFDEYAVDQRGAFRGVMLATSHFNVSGSKVGCFPLESLLQSTLECFFDRNCLDRIIQLFSASHAINISTLDLRQTRFSPMATIATMIDDLFIERWSTNSSFEEYYNSCAPVTCTYNFEKRNSALYIFTVLLSLYGGLTVVLRFCLPKMIAWWRKRTPLHSNEAIPWRIRIGALGQWTSAELKTLNLYDSLATRTDPDSLMTAIISTRTYLLLLCSSIIILAGFTWFDIRTHTVTIEKPSESMYKSLNRRYAMTLFCPCQQIANRYGTFMSLAPLYHPICSSFFISDEWIYVAYSEPSATGYRDARDFRQVAPNIFSTLASLCSLGASTVSDAWYIFNQSSLINDEVLSEEELRVQVNQTFEQFKRNTINDFKRGLMSFQLHAYNMIAMGYANTVMHTTALIHTMGRIDFYPMPVTWNNCSCGITEQCRESVGMYTFSTTEAPNLTLLFNIPDMYIGCFVLPAIFQSSLRCFFNQSCLNAIQENLIHGDSLNMSALDDRVTRFLPETRIELLVNELLIEEWGSAINYKQYYVQCAPKFCTYTFQSRNNILYAVATLTGLIGGLSATLKFLAPLLIKWIRNRNRARNETQETQVNSVNRISTGARLATTWTLAKGTLCNLNVFDSEATWYNDERRRAAIIATRVYFIVLITITIMLATYTSAVIQTQQWTISQPSQNTVEALQSNPSYSSTLECPCQSLVVPYKSFVSITPQLHQVCSSDFVNLNSSWFDLIFDKQAIIKYPFYDFRIFIVPQFRLLHSLCTIANETLSDAVSLFLSTTLISKRAQSRSMVATQMEVAIAQFNSSTSRTFVRMLDFIRQMAHGNGLVSSISSNWYFVSLDRIVGDSTPLWSKARSYNDNTCSCAVNSTCTSPASVSGWLVPGFRVGCDPLESLLQSTLECLYDVSCVNDLKSMNSFSEMEIRPLDPIRSASQATVQSLLEGSLVEHWTSSVSYDQYYAICAPSSCTYSLDTRPNIVYILTKIIGLYGGLSVVLRVIVPLLVNTMRHILAYRRHRVEP